MRLLGRSRPDEPLPQARQVTPGLLEARRAHADARRGLEEVIEQGAATRGVVGRIAEHGKRNHWSQLIDDIWT